ncbi:MAG: hypothetical protein CMP59_01975 [Flavobacteriales bacterium]|nr:hypothetical protein [Flavobacteriales bacterium]
MKAATVLYKVKIIDEEIVLENGLKHSKTAVIEKWKNNHQLASRKFGAPDLEEIYKKIEKKEEINLDFCYLKDFSLSDYRLKHNLSETEEIEILSFSAANAFFDSIFGTDFSYSHFVGDPPSFAYATFDQGNINFGHCRCKTSFNFNRSEFHVDELSFRFAEFEGAEIRFSSSLLDCENILFVNTNFVDGKVSFRQTDFEYSNVNFQYARFDKADLSFDKAIFKGDHIDFRKVEFGDGRKVFRRVDFGDGNVNFNEAEFKEAKINFRNARFGEGYNTLENVDFGPNHVQFDGLVCREGYLSFKGSVCKTISFVDSRLYGHCDFRIKKGQLLDFSHSIFKDILDFQAGEEEVDLQTLKIEGVKNLGKIFISWENNNVYKLLTSQKGTSLESKAKQFNLLKVSYNSNGEYAYEDKAYVAFKLFEMKHNYVKSSRKNFIGKIRGSLVYAFHWLVFYKAGLFATAPLRVFISMLAVITFFASIYIILPHFANADILSSVGGNEGLSMVQKSFYHSAITFFTIGYGDFYPSGHIRWISSVEGWAGVFLMSYFTVAFVRKILR